MIIWTSKKIIPAKTLLPGDSFVLKHNDTTLLEQLITVETVVDCIGTFVFANEDGTVPCVHSIGFFGSQYNLPRELQKAKTVDQLSEGQYNNYFNSRCLGETKV